jgi:hypothetical protein
MSTPIPSSSGTPVPPTIIPVRPAIAEPAARPADTGWLRRTLGRYTPSRRTLGRGNPSRRTLGVFHPSRRTLGLYHP